MTLVATRQVISRGKKLADVNSKIAAEKDGILQRDLREKELQIQGAKKDVSDAKTKQAKAEKSLLELQQQINEPRVLDTAIANKILDSGGKGSVQFGFVATSDEAGKLADELAKIFTDHGWTVDSAVNPMIGSPPPPPGVSIWIKGGRTALEKMTPLGIEHLPEPAKTLYELLDEAIIGNRGVDVWTTAEPPTDKLMCS